MLFLAKFLALPRSAHLAILAVVLVGGLQIKHVLQVRSLNGQITAIAAQRDQELRAKLEYKAALSDVTANRDALTSDLRRQNDAIGRLKADMEAQAQAASLSAVRALQQGREDAAALRQPKSTVPPGHVAMNDWLAERVGQ